MTTMSTLRRGAVIPVTLLWLVACGNDESSEGTKAPTATEAPDVTSADTIPVTSTGETIETTARAGAVQIDVVIGVDSGPDRVETVAVGTEVTLTVTSPNSDDEVHVHGIDLELPVTAGESVSFTFVVDTVGEIEVESHVTSGVLVVIEVV